MKKAILYLSFSLLLFPGCTPEEVEVPETTANLQGNAQHAEAEVAETLTAIFTAIDQKGSIPCWPFTPTALPSPISRTGCHEPVRRGTRLPRERWST